MLGPGDYYEQQTRDDERRASRRGDIDEADEPRFCAICEGEPAVASAIIEHVARGCIAVCPEHHAEASEADQISSAWPTVLL